MPFDLISPQYFVAWQVGAGLECGIGMEDFDDFEEGDILKAYNTRQKRRTLEEASAQIVAALEGAGIRR